MWSGGGFAVGGKALGVWLCVDVGIDGLVLLLKLCRGVDGLGGEVKRFC